MDTLQQIFKKLNNSDKHFTKIYDITIEKIWGTDLIRITRKSPKMDESYTYSTDTRVNYNNNAAKLCFDIYVKKNFFFLTEVRVIACHFNNDSERIFGLGIDKKHHVQSITLYDVDINAIITYICDMEHEINYDNSKKNIILASNEYRCKDCERKMDKYGYKQ
jgi:hypothetical protein